MNVKGGNSPPGKQLHHAGRNLNVVETQEVGRRPWRKERPGTWTSGNDSDIQNVCCGFVICGLYYIEVGSFCAHFLKTFYDKWVLNLLKAFSASIEIIM